MSDEALEEALLRPNPNDRDTGGRNALHILACNDCPSSQLLVTAANKCTMKNLTVQELFGLPGVAQAIYEMRVDADMLNFKPTNVAALCAD